MTEWRKIPDWPDYWVSDDGQISKHGGPENGVLKVLNHKKGYFFVCLRRPGSRSKTTMYVHRAVLLAFVGPPPFGNAQAHHKDGYVDNNAKTNLVWRISVNQYDYGIEEDYDKYPSSPEDEEENQRIIEALGELK